MRCEMVEVRPGRREARWFRKDTGEPCRADGSRYPKADRIHLSIRSDPNTFAGNSSQLRWMEPIHEKGRPAHEFEVIDALRCQSMEGRWAGYVPGRGPRPFRSFEEKKRYMKQSGLVEVGDMGDPVRG